MANKKDGLRIVDMCKYIDEHIYTDDYDEVKIFDYLKTTIQSIALHKKYFHHLQDYEPFSVYMATRIFLRLVNKKQFLPDNDPHKLAKVKSVLNMIKKLFYPCKVEYQNSAYNLVIKAEFDDTSDLYTHLQNELVETVINTQQTLLKVDVEEYLRQIKRIIWEIINSTPYTDKVIKNNLYVSVLISFLRSITLSNKNKKRISSNYFYNNARLYEETLNEIYKTEQDNAPVVWNLDVGFIPYIKILLLRVQEKIIQDIQELRNYQIPNEDFITEVLMEPLKEINND